MNSKDQGIDAEWDVELGERLVSTSPLLGPGWNVFQYKQRDALSQVRPKILRALAAGLEGAVRTVAKRVGRRPRRYVLFTNLDLSHATKGQKGLLKRRMLKGWAGSRVHVEIVGAAELASILNTLPAVRSCFFSPARFETWESAWDKQKRRTLLGRHVSLIGREEELQSLRALMDDPAVRVIVLSGAHAIGKSRLALEGCAGRPLEPVVALDPKTMSTSDLLALESPRTETLVIVDDPEPERAEEFVREALGRDRLKLILTLPTPEPARAPNFGHDPRVRTLPVEPLSDTRAEELLRAAGAQLDYSLQAWIIDQAGGNPGVLLLAANLGPDLRQAAASFGEEVSSAFLRRIRTMLGADAARILRLLSLLTHVGIERDAASELEAVCRLFGEGITPNAVLNELPALVQSGVVRQAGAYVEVAPPVLANNLAEAAIRGRAAAVVALFGTLGQMARMRLVRRLRSLKGSGVDEFWQQLVGDKGLFKDFHSVVDNGYLFRQIASAVPERAGKLLEEGLSRLTLEERRDMTGDARRELVWTFEELLFRSETSAVALRCLLWLAEAENEGDRNNASGEFCEVFQALHPQMPLPLLARLEFLKDVLAASDRREAKLLTVRAIDTALRGSGAVSLRRGSGPDPLGTRPPLTYGEIWNYMESLAGLLFQVAESTEGELALAAQVALPHALAKCAVQARPQWAIAALRRLIERVAQGAFTVDLSNLANSLRFVQDSLEDVGARRPEAQAELQGFREEVKDLIDQVDRGDFATRFKRWLGGWGLDDHDQVGQDAGKPVYRSEVEIRTLAQEAIDQPAELTETLLAWLNSGAAQKSGVFAWWLGRLDLAQSWRPKIERIGRERNGVTVFSSYCSGLAQHSRDAVSQRLDTLLQEKDIVGEALVSATSGLGGDLAGVERVEVLLSERRADPTYTAKILSCGGWINPLNPTDYLRLLRAIAGPDLEHAVAVVDFLGMWLHTGRAVDGPLMEFAWRCLESMPKITSNDEYDFDQLGARLVPLDPDRGFRLLDGLLKQPSRRETWNPLSHNPERKFWSALRTADRQRAVRLVFAAAARNSRARVTITWDLREVLDQEQDGELLIQYALEGRAQAELVADTITAGRPGFWPIAFKIIEAFPQDKALLADLAHGAEHRGLMIGGPFSAHYARCGREVKSVRAEPETPRAVWPWLDRLEDWLRLEAERQLLIEVEENVNELRRVIEHPAAPERLWAATTLVRLGKVSEALQLFPKEELLKVIGDADLPGSAKRDLRKILNRLA